MTKGKIRDQVKRISDARVRLAAEEQQLALEIWKYLRPHGSLRTLASRLKISPQYLCDIAHGRRKISEAVVEKVMDL